MMNPKAVVFDLGKVLVEFDYSIARRRIAARSRPKAAGTEDFIEHTPLLLQYETGLINRQQFFDAICRKTGFVGTLDEFGEFFADIFTPIPAMVELNETLRQHGTPTFIFSNTNDLAVDHIRRNFPFFANFSGYVFSFEHKAMKPDPKLYQVVETLTGCAGAEILYLDDRVENIDEGRRRGWQVIHHQEPGQTIPIVEKMW